jgi:hypothetical protein
MASATSELIWIKQLLKDIKNLVAEPMQMYCDNQTVKHIASNLVFHEKSKTYRSGPSFCERKNSVRINQNTIC